MTATSVEREQATVTGRRRTGFIPAAGSFLAVFIAGATPIPLYDTYRTENRLTNAELSLAAVGYFAFAILALLVLGRLSNHLGRKPVAIAAVLAAIIGSAVFTLVDGPAPLIIGRALQGLAAGLASSALAAYAVDTAPKKPRWLIATITSAATTVGLAIGAFGSGALVEFAPMPRELVFLAAIVMLLVCLVAIIASPDSVARNSGALASLRPRLELPVAARKYIPAAAAIFISTWAFGGYYQAFGPSVAADDLHSRSALVAAAVFASWMAPAVFGGPLASRFRPAVAQRLGMTLVAVAAGGLVLAIALASAALFIVAGVVGGIGMGIGMAGSMHALLPEAKPHQRAGLLSLIYAVSYLGAAVPSLIAGQLARFLSLAPITAGYAVLAVVALIVALITAREPSTEEGTE
jgi:MFS family permease